MPSTASEGTDLGKGDASRQALLRTIQTTLALVTVTDHCIDRGIDDTISRYTAQSYVDACLAKPDFATAWPCIENNTGPHSGGHVGVGGQVRAPSPNAEKKDRK